MSKQDVYVAKMKLQLDELNLKLAQFEAKANEAGHETRAAVDDEMTRLRGHAREAGTQLAAVKAAAAGSWHAMVADMEKLRHAFTDAFATFKSQV